MLELEQMGNKGKDSVGKLVGWSIGTGIAGHSISDMLALPCVYDFKAVGPAGDAFVGSLLARVGGRLGRDIESHEYFVKHSSKGNYSSITLRLYVQTLEEVYAIYAAIKEDKSVKYVL